MTQRPDALAFVQKLAQSGAYFALFHMEALGVVAAGRESVQLAYQAANEGGVVRRPWSEPDGP